MKFLNSKVRVIAEWFIEVEKKTQLNKKTAFPTRMRSQFPLSISDAFFLPTIDCVTCAIDVDPFPMMLTQSPFFKRNFLQK